MTTLDVGASETFYGPDAPGVSDLQDVIPNTPSWQIKLQLHTGQHVVIPEVAHLVISNPDYGEFHYCRALAGNYSTVQWLDKGGSVIVLYTLIADQLYIGLMTQDRVTQVRNKKVYEVPRGFREADEDPLTTAKRELLEEVGLPINEGDIIPIGVGNPNNTFAIGCSLKYFAGFVNPGWVQLIEDTHHYQLLPHVLKDNVQKKHARLKEGIECTEFVPYSEVAQLVASDPWRMGSMPMLSAITLLTFHLQRLGITWH